MKLVVFGLAISSSWGNGHATLWRGLCRALTARGHRVIFFERDRPYYAAHRDLVELAGGRLHIYDSWDSIARTARRELEDADAGVVTSFCADGVEAETVLLDSSTPRRIFYDLDTPVTLENLARGEPVPYIGPAGLCRYDVVLSYTGGASLSALSECLGARRSRPLYGSVDPSVHSPCASVDRFRCDLSYLATYSADRQDSVDRLFLEPARRAPRRKFLLGGSQYPANFPWGSNVSYARHVVPDEHRAFYCSSRLTLSTTRRAMAATGYCPSGRLFEAAACGVPVLSDWWPGLDGFFQPDREILIAHRTEQVLDALERSDEELTRIGRLARERTLAQHTAEHRAIELERILESVGRADAGASHNTATEGAAGVTLGHHSGGGGGHAHSATGVLEGAAPGREPARRQG